MKSMKNLLRALGVILLIAGALYLYQKRNTSHESVKVQNVFSNASSGMQSVNQQGAARQATQDAATAKAFNYLLTNNR